MCIRDSIGCVSVNYEDVRIRVGTVPDLDVSLNPATICDGAVSYTHLRAHETVLDLVCRLLLEKKNNTQYK